MIHSPTPLHPAPDPTPVPLCSLAVGDVAVIVDKHLADDDRALLRAMGLERSATLRVCRVGEPCIVAVTTAGAQGGRLDAGCCRIGLARPLAERIIVTVNRHQHTTPPTSTI